MHSHHCSWTGYFLAQKVSPQLGHSSSTSYAKNGLTFRVAPVLRYAVTDTSSPQPAHGLVVIFFHQSRSHFCITPTYAHSWLAKASPVDSITNLHTSGAVSGGHCIASARRLEASSMYSWLVS